jgi:hypothetical protein
MKRLWSSACLLPVITLTGFAQASAEDLSFVAMSLDLRHTISSSIEQKRLTRMGDSVAPAIAEVIGKTTVSPAILERVLGVMRGAFERPSIITNPADRKPTATLALLGQLEKDRSWDAPALLEIASARQYVIAAVSK